MGLKKFVLCTCLLLTALTPICSAKPFSQMTQEEREAWMDREQQQVERDYAAAQRQIAEGRRQQVRMREEFGKNVETLAGFALGGWLLKGAAVLFGLGCLSKIANRKNSSPVVICETVYRTKPTKKNNQKKQNQPKQQPPQNKPEKVETPAEEPVKKKRKRRKKKKTQPEQ